MFSSSFHLWDITRESQAMRWYCSPTCELIFAFLVEQLITDAAIQISKSEERIKQDERYRGSNQKTESSQDQKPRLSQVRHVLHLFLLSPPLLRVKHTLHVSYLLTLRNLSAEHASIVGLGIHQCQSSRRRGFVFRVIVNWVVQAVRSCDPDPTVSHDR